MIHQAQTVFFLFWPVGMEESDLPRQQGIVLSMLQQEPAGEVAQVRVWSFNLIHPDPFLREEN